MESPAVATAFSQVVVLRFAQQMQRFPIVMGPVDVHRNLLMAPPPFTVNGDKLRWRRDARSWTSTTMACGDGEDERCKGMYAALGMVLYRSLPPSLQQLVKKVLKAGDTALDPSNTGYCKEPIATIETIISIAAKDSAPESIKILAKLSKNLFSTKGKVFEKFRCT